MKKNLLKLLVIFFVLIQFDSISEEKNYHGFEVEDIQFGNIGKVSNKIQTSNYSVLVVKKQNREVFIPMHDNFILEINDEKIKVKIDEDLLNLNN